MLTTQCVGNGWIVGMDEKPGESGDDRMGIMIDPRVAPGNLKIIPAGKSEGRMERVRGWIGRMGFSHRERPGYPQEPRR
jgi:hypothetical protein